MNKTPKLRFKDKYGYSYPEWKTTNIENIANIEKGFTPSTTDMSLWGGDIPWLSISDMKQGKYIDKTSKTITKLGLANKKITPKETLIMSFKLTLGKMAILKKDMVTNEAICHFYWKNKNIDNEFMYYNMSNINIESFGGRAVKGITLNNDSINSIVVKLPSLSEQKKIASFFSLIDDKISLQSEKVEMLKDYKKGMMQKIFSRELRFKDDEGRDYPEWEVTTIEKVANLEKGFTPDTKNEKKWIGEIPWLSIADMKQGKYITEVSKYISDESLGNKKLVPTGTLIMSFKLTLGRLAIVNRDIMTNEAICHFYWKDKNISTEYMYYYLSTVNIESFGCRAAKGITLNNDSLNSIVVKLPNIHEQNKICNVLGSIDKKIEKEQEKLDSLNEYKKGLLQQMFV